MGTRMKTGIIGLPQVGKTSLFKILTKARLEERGHSRQEHIGVARVPDERLDKLSALYSPKKTTYASVEFVDVAAIGQEALKETAFLTSLRQVDALIHVLRAFEDESIPHVGPIDPLRDIKQRRVRPDDQRPDPGGKAAGAAGEGPEEGAHQRSGARTGAAAAVEGGSGKGAAAARTGDDAGGEEAHQGLHVPLAKAHSIRA